MHWDIRADPEMYPQRSTAWQGYLWKVEATPTLAFLTDLDAIAAYEERNGRNVSIINLEAPLVDGQLRIESREQE